MVAGLSFPLEGFLFGLTAYRFDQEGGTAVVLVLSWVSRWIWLLAAINIPFTLLLYPNGQLPSRRWRPVLWAMIGLIAVAWVAAAFSPEPMEEVGGLPNPLGIEAVEPLWVVFPLLYLLPVVGAIALVARHSKATPLVRQQIKLLAWGAAVSVVYFAFNTVAAPAPAVNSSLNIVFTFFLGSVITAGIVRYRLFDIDRLISRTVSYALVVLTLAGVYFAGVTLVSRVLDPQSDLGVAASTLVVAALFNPLRHRLQVLVDRYFHRSRYDSQLVVSGIASRLRDEIDIDRVTSEWLSAVEESVRPVSMGVWMGDQFGRSRPLPTEFAHWEPSTGTE